MGLARWYRLFILHCVCKRPFCSLKCSSRSLNWNAGRLALTNSTARSFPQSVVFLFIGYLFCYVYICLILLNKSISIFTTWQIQITPTLKKSVNKHHYISLFQQLFFNYMLLFIILSNILSYRVYLYFTSFGIFGWIMASFVWTIMDQYSGIQN